MKLRKRVFHCVHTSAKVSENVVALLRKGYLVDSVPDVAGFQHLRGILSCIPPVVEPLEVRVQPINDVGTYETILNLYNMLHMERSNSPINALGMVILSHILSRTSSPESGLAIARTTTGISVRTLKCISSIVPTQI
jgi:hypothetical protein